jgi:hypothetical protein
MDRAAKIPGEVAGKSTTGGGSPRGKTHEPEPPERTVFGGPAAAGGPLAARGLKPVEMLARDKPHGTRLKYLGGCGCLPCRAANSRYECGRALARRHGDWNGIVSAARARRHLVSLAKAGLGYKRVGEIARIGSTPILSVRAGRKRRIRARTERKIVAVSRAHRAGAAIVPAARTWRQIAWLLGEGFTRGRIAREALGNKRPTLQLRKSRILQRSATKIEAFWRRWQQ